MKREWTYLRFLKQSIKAVNSSIDRINSVNDPYGREAAIILFSNAWELLAKAILLKKKKSIKGDVKGTTIYAEDAINRLVVSGDLDAQAARHIQQIISLRNSYCHEAPSFNLPDEILFHLMFFATKTFKDLVKKNFPNHSKPLSKNFLSIGFDTFTTYADKVQKLISRAKRSGTPENNLVWVLERGVRYEGGKYMSQPEFQRKIQKSRPMSSLKLGDFVNTTDMVVVVPVQAPKGFTADLQLRKGGKGHGSLPVHIKKTNVEEDFPYLTLDLAKKLEKNRNFVSYMIIDLGRIKNNPEFHQEVRTGRRGTIHRYSDAALSELKSHLEKNPGYAPPYPKKAKKAVI